MFKIGCHLSSAKGFKRMGREALDIKANTFQFFMRNPRGARAKEIKPADAAALKAMVDGHQLSALMAHPPYIINPCAAKPELLELTMEILADDIKRLETYLPGNFYNLHPGSHVGQGTAIAVSKIAHTLNQVIDPAQSTMLLLETMSGSGSEIGGHFHELRAIINEVEHDDKLGVCLDTCHVFAAGYDIVNDLDGVLSRFDKIIGLKRLRAVHLNDSLRPLNSKKDRHARLGEGEIGLPAIARIINHEALRPLPFYLETPNELEGYAREIALLKKMYQ